MKKVIVSDVTARGLNVIGDIRDAGIEVKEVIPADVEKGRKYDICIGNISVGGIELSIRLGKSLLANVEPDEAEYIVNSIMEITHNQESNSLLWAFQSEAQDFRGIARLYDLEDYGWVIALCGRFKTQQSKARGIIRVIPLDSLIGNEYKSIELTMLKIRLAKALDERYILSNEEWTARNKERGSTRSQRNEQWKDQQRRIRDRKKINVFNVDGLKLYGLPITENEINYIPDNTPVIIVSSYDEETSEIGELLEACFIRRRKSGSVKAGVKDELSWDEPAEEIGPPVEAITLLVDDKEESFTLFSKEALDGFCGGNISMTAIIAVDDPNEEEEYPVYQLSKRSSECLGYFPTA